MIVCHCKGITDRQIRRAVLAGAFTLDDVGRACEAASGCGGCASAVRSVIASVRDAGESSSGAAGSDLCAAG